MLPLTGVDCNADAGPLNWPGACAGRGPNLPDERAGKNMKIWMRLLPRSESYDPMAAGIDRNTM
jgi:hypothetical protein